MHSVWSGYITFGLVNIPVKAVAARASHDLQLTGLHADCGTPVKQRRHCLACGDEAAAETMVRGVKVTADRYALVSPEELQSLGTPAKKRLELLEFVDLDQVDPVYFEKPYFLRPAAEGERPYALLVRSLTDNRRVGVGKVALRDREHLALVRPVKHALVMHLIGFPDEVRSLEQAVPPREVAIEPQALELMRLLVEAMTRPFAECDYRDRRRDELQALVEEKIRSKADPQSTAPVRPEVGNLMEMLRRQLRAVQDESPAVRGTTTTFS